MKSFRRRSQSVNAGSMADIAFLLLIFFLVTTTISADKGILRKLPSECPPGVDCSAELLERNVLRIALNDNQDILIEDELASIEDVVTIVKDFLDNNGKSECKYCTGAKLETLSDSPQDAVISLSHSAFTKYELFVTVQDKITKAYYELRARYAKEKFNKSPEDLTEKELKAVKTAYPFKVSEVLLKR